MSSQNEKQAAAYFKRLWTGDRSAAGEFLSPGARMFGGDGKLRAEGIQAFQAVAGEYMNALSDIEVQIEDIFSRGEKVVLFWKFEGIHRNPFKGIPPKGNRVSITGVHTMVFEDGKIIEERYVYDSHGFYEQLQADRHEEVPRQDLEDEGLGAYARDIRYIASLIAGGAEPEKVQEKWEGFVHGHVSELGALDVMALVQAVLRESYLETTRSLRDYADKVKFYNEIKGQVRSELQQAREMTERWLAEIEEKLQAADEDAQLANVDLQNKLQQLQQILHMMSNLSKMLHDAAVSIIRNFKS